MTDFDAASADDALCPVCGSTLFNPTGMSVEQAAGIRRNHLRAAHPNHSPDPSSPSARPTAAPPAGDPTGPRSTPGTATGGDTRPAGGKPGLVPVPGSASPFPAADQPSTPDAAPDAAAGTPGRSAAGGGDASRSSKDYAAARAVDKIDNAPGGLGKKAIEETGFSKDAVKDAANVASAAGSAVTGGKNDDGSKKTTDDAVQELSDQGGNIARTGAMAAGAYFGGKPGAQAVDKAVNSKVGRKATDLVGDTAMKSAKPALKPLIGTARTSFKVMKAIVKAHIVLSAFILILIMALIGGVIQFAATVGGHRGYLWNVQVNPAQVDIPPAYLEAYYAAGEGENVPWTVLAAMGARGSYHGRVDPYRQAVPAPVPRLAGYTGAPVTAAGTAGYAPGGTVYPTQSADMGSTYNQWGNWTVNVRADGQGQHKGVDFRGSEGTPVFAAAGGVVKFAGVGTGGNSYCGVTVVISLGGGRENYYCHLRKALVSAGTQVAAGTQIGEIGNTGRSFGAHLHFELRENGQWADPMPMLAGAGTPRGGAGGTVQQAAYTPAATVTSLYLVGDSLSVGTGPAMRQLTAQRGIDYTETAVSGKSLKWGLQQVAARPPAPGSPVVIALGSNPSDDFAGDVQRMMGRLPSTSPVYWLTIDVPDAYGRQYNEDLIALQGRFPNMRVLDWLTYARSQGIDPAKSDSAMSIHLTGDWYKVRAKYILDNVTGATQPVSYGQAAPITLSGPGVLPEPEGSCPTLTSPIKGPSRVQGAGPLMLSSANLESYGGALSVDDLQNVCLSAVAAAKVLRATAERVAAERGLEYPYDFYDFVEKAEKGDAGMTQQLQQFWVDVVNRADIIGGTDDKRCDADARPENMPMGEWVSASIATVWSCYLADARLRSVRGEAGAGGTTKFVEMPRLDARKRALKEALDVAWMASAWGTRPCDPEATYAGVFPLTQAAFDRFVPDRLRLMSDGETLRTRCDPEANISAAARAFRSGEVTVPATRAAGSSGWGRTYGGWTLFGDAVLGPQPVRDSFMAAGPMQTVVVTGQCSAAAASALLRFASDPANPYRGHTARDLQNYANAGTPLPSTAAFDGYLNGKVKEIEATRQCPGISGDKWIWVLNSANGEDGVSETGASPTSSAELLRTTAADKLDGPAGPGDVVVAMKKRVAERFTGREVVRPVIGTTAILARFSPKSLADSGSPSATVRITSEDVGSEIVGIASNVYGGLFPGPLGAAMYTAAGVPGGGQMAQIALQLAQEKIGSPYVAGTRGPNSFDCSGFTWWLYNQAGLDWSMSWAISYKQWWPERYGLPAAKYTVQVPIGQEQPGDLIFFDSPGTAGGTPDPVRLAHGRVGVDHVGIVEDPQKGTFIHASNPTDGVKRSNYKDSYYKPKADGSGLVGFARAVDPSATMFTPVSGSLLAQASALPPDMRPFEFQNNGNSRMGDWRKRDHRVLPNTNRAIAVQLMVEKFKFPITEWPCLDRMWWHESGWKHINGNPSSGYGIPQADPGTKMASAGPDWRTNPATQIVWGLRFIKNYGLWHSYTPRVEYPGPQERTPCGVWEKWRWSGKIQGHGNY